MSLIQCPEESFNFEFERNGEIFKVILTHKTCSFVNLSKELNQNSLVSYQKEWTDIVYSCIEKKFELPSFSIKVISKISK